MSRREVFRKKYIYLMIFSSILMSILHISTTPFFRLIRTGLRLLENFFYKLFFLSSPLSLYSLSIIIYSSLKNTLSKSPCISWWSYSNLNNYSSRWIDRFDGNISRIPKNVAALKHVERRFVRGFIFNISLLTSEPRRVRNGGRN